MEIFRDLEGVRVSLSQMAPHVWWLILAAACLLMMYRLVDDALSKGRAA